MSGRLAASVSSSAEWARHHFSSARLSEGSHDEGTHVRGVSQQRGSFRCRAGLVERLFWGGGGFGGGQPAWVNCQVIVPSVRPTWSLQRTPTWAPPGNQERRQPQVGGRPEGGSRPQGPGKPAQGWPSGTRVTQTLAWPRRSLSLNRPSQPRRSGQRGHAPRPWPLSQPRWPWQPLDFCGGPASGLAVAGPGVPGPPRWRCAVTAEWGPMRGGQGRG